MPSRSDTPTPGDLSARLQAWLLRHDLNDARSTETRALVSEAAAALSALPAGGDVPEDWVRFGFHGERVACRPAIAERVQNALLREVMTGIEQREATTPPADADVGAQGEGYDDGSGRVRDWRAPAAGKGVDDAWRSIVYAALRSIRYNANNGSQDRPQHQRLHLIGVEAERAIAALEAALTRQPVAGDGWRPIESAPRDGTRVLLRLKHGLPAHVHGFEGVVFVGKWLGGHSHWAFAAPVGQAGFPDEWMDGWCCAAPADTPADGGEGKS